MGLKDLVTISPQAIEFFLERLDLAFCFQQCLRERAAPAALADEVDEIRQSPFLGGQFRLLEPNGFGDMRVELADLRLDALEDVLDVLSGRELRPRGVGDDPRSVATGAHRAGLNVGRAERPHGNPTPPIVHSQSTSDLSQAFGVTIRSPP